MSSSNRIRENHYGRNIRFTRAVDELDIIRSQALVEIGNQCRTPTPQPQTQPEPQPVIMLDRLTAQQISDAQNGNLSHWGIETSDGKKRTAKKKQKQQQEQPNRYNLRKR